ncbi:hypothetical protein CF326_g1793 [Tilletia indica]|nr:hypothetical protein CF326_g1793 [Tilletia indica]
MSTASVNRRVVVCICYSRCRSQLESPGVVVTVSTRDRHRQEDLDILHAGAFRGANAAALLRDSCANNFFAPTIVRPSDLLPPPQISLAAGGDVPHAPSDTRLLSAPVNQDEHHHGMADAEQDHGMADVGHDGSLDGIEDDIAAIRIADGQDPRFDQASSFNADDFPVDDDAEEPEDVDSPDPPFDEEDAEDVESSVPAATIAEDMVAALGGMPSAVPELPAALSDAAILRSITRTLRSSLFRDPMNSYLWVDGQDQDELLRLSPPADLAASFTEDDLLTLDFYSAWIDAGSPESAYKRFADVHRKKGDAIHTLYHARRMFERCSEVHPITFDMCRSSCAAYTGPRSADLTCPLCGLNRFKDDGTTPFKTYQYTPLLPRLQAYYSNTFWANQLRYRAERMDLARRAFDTEDGTPSRTHVFGDVTDGYVHTEPDRRSELQDPRDCVVLISTDGAQMLEGRRPSSAWVVLLQLVNLPPSFRFNPDHLHVSLLVPGPDNPVDLESFVWPLCAELAQLGLEGTPTWDASSSEWFRLRVHLGGVLGDQPASAKLSRLTGHSGVHGCRVCLIRGIRERRVPYFPLRILHGGLETNSGRCQYDPNALPIRTMASYAEAVQRLGRASATQRPVVQRDTGVVTLPLVAYSTLFNIPDFFPLDPFHLFNMNVPSLIWKTLNSPLAGEFGLEPAQRIDFGTFIGTNKCNYPTHFSSRAPRDISQYGNSNYRMVEWGSVFHHFLPAFLHSIGAPQDVRDMLDDFLIAVDMAMCRHGLSVDQIGEVKRLFVSFVMAWERLYVSEDAALSRATLSVHHLLHVSEQIFMLGSIRATSQATCERYMGILKKGLSAFRFPYASMTIRSIHRTQATISKIRLGVKLGALRTSPPTPEFSIYLTSGHHDLTRLQKDRLRELVRGLVPGPDAVAEYGRFVTPSGIDIRGLRATQPDTRSSSVVKYRTTGGDVRVGRVVHFQAVFRGRGLAGYAFLQLFHIQEQSRTVTVGHWVSQWVLVPCDLLVEVVAALDLGHNTVYIVSRSAWQHAVEEQGIGPDED